MAESCGSIGTLSHFCGIGDRFGLEVKKKVADALMWRENLQQVCKVIDNDVRVNINLKTVSFYCVNVLEERFHQIRKSAG